MKIAHRRDAHLSDNIIWYLSPAYLRIVFDIPVFATTCGARKEMTLTVNKDFRIGRKHKNVEIFGNIWKHFDLYCNKTCDSFITSWFEIRSLFCCELWRLIFVRTVWPNSLSRKLSRDLHPKVKQYGFYDYISMKIF